MPDLRRQIFESGKTVSRKAASREASRTNSHASSKQTSRQSSRAASRQPSDDEDGGYLSDDTAMRLVHSLHLFCPIYFCFLYSFFFLFCVHFSSYPYGPTRGGMMSPSSLSSLHFACVLGQRTDQETLTVLDPSTMRTPKQTMPIGPRN